NRRRTGRHHPAVVGAERRGENGTEVTMQEHDRCAGGGVPDPRVVVSARRYDQLSVMTECDAVDTIGVPAQRVQEPTAVDVPELRGAVVERYRERSSVGAEGQVVNRRSLEVQGSLRWPAELVYADRTALGTSYKLSPL